MIHDHWKYDVKESNIGGESIIDKLFIVITLIIKCVVIKGKVNHSSYSKLEPTHHKEQRQPGTDEERKGDGYT